MYTILNKAVYVSIQSHCSCCFTLNLVATVTVNSWQHCLVLTFLEDSIGRFSERTVQGIVVVFKVLQLKEVSGPLAALLH